MVQKPLVLAVVGSTAGGKSSLAVALAKAVGGEVVSCDSMQIYREMEIGTAKPTEAEMEGVPHHLIDFVAPTESFSCADYVREAERSIREITERGRIPILCGGTGLYLDRLLCGTTTEVLPERNEAIRRELEEVRLREGNEGLHRRLSEVDPVSAEGVHPNNYPRVMRALEIYRLTGVPKSEWDRRSAEAERPYDHRVIGLRYGDRSLLYRRIDDRVDQMLERGLLEETRRLWRAGVFEVNATAAQAIGYKELLPCVRGEERLEEAVERLKTATRRYAKRQITWFGAKDYVRWIEADRGGACRPLEELVDDALRAAELTAL